MRRWMNDLLARLEALHAAQPERAVTIDPRSKPLATTYADIVQVLNLAVLAGFMAYPLVGL